MRQPDEIMVYDVSEEQATTLAAHYDICTVGKSLEETVTGADFVLLAIKPQNVDSLMKELVGDDVVIILGCPNVV
jgi:pyrroline-5-carboxylate reductase